MNRTTRALAIAAGFLVTGASGCMDPTTEPKSTPTTANIFNDPNSYRAFLARIYAGLIVTGQVGPNGNGDIYGIDEGTSEYLRLLWYLQELPTEEAVIGWNDPGVPEMNTGTWDARNTLIVAMYYRVYFQVMLVNEFLRQTTDAMLDSRGQTDAAFRATIATYRAEARFLRALAYWHGIDLFGNIPLVTEDDPITTTPPPQATRQEIYDYVVSELTDIVDDLPAKSADTYARATPAAAHMLLAKLYLNAAVYTGAANYAGALTEATAVIGSGYSLAPNFFANFTANNNTSPELVFVAAQDARNTQTWGGMTFLIHAGCGGSMSSATYGIDYCWGGYRLKQQAYYWFNATDGRASVFHRGSGPDSQWVNVEQIGEFRYGVAAPKFNNLGGAQTGMVDTDFPVFRLADAYLIYAEAWRRGGGGDSATAYQYVNALRSRAGGIAPYAPGQLALDSILVERGRELLFEATRRTDLIRFGRFTSGTYLWAWKGGAKGGTALLDGRDLYPLPANELVANPNLTQNPGY